MDSDARGKQALYGLFASVRNAKEAALLLEDILTPRELSSVAERWKLIQALSSGMKQREINKKLKISISKITRGSRALRYGKGGFALFIKRMKKAAK
ncbi:transcriptional regulator [Candidatus Peregrinibacteria bacterium]|nr:transcriptional regulator [Candidatus Peregrinibacteria bacterium]